MTCELPGCICTLHIIASGKTHFDLPEESKKLRILGGFQNFDLPGYNVKWTRDLLPVGTGQRKSMKPVLQAWRTEVVGGRYTVGAQIH